MKKILSFAIVLCMVTLTTLFVHQKINKNISLSLLNIEALATGEGVEDCDILVYNRNYAEQATHVTIQAEAGGGLYIEYNGHRVTIGADAEAGGTVKVYYCETSPGNCCIKSWLEKPIEYL